MTIKLRAGFRQGQGTMCVVPSRAEGSLADCRYNVVIDNRRPILLRTCSDSVSSPPPRIRFAGGGLGLSLFAPCWAMWDVWLPPLHVIDRGVGMVEVAEEKGY